MQDSVRGVEKTVAVILEEDDPTVGVLQLVTAPDLVPPFQGPPAAQQPIVRHRDLGEKSQSTGIQLGFDGNCDRSQGPGKRFLDKVMLSSPDHRGATGPLLFAMGFGIQYVGEERVTVGAGEFNAYHFQVTDTAGNLPEEHPPYNVWCTADEDYILLKAGAEGYMMTHYELMELEIIE